MSTNKVQFIKEQLATAIEEVEEHQCYAACVILVGEDGAMQLVVAEEQSAAQLLGYINVAAHKLTQKLSEAGDKQNAQNKMAEILARVLGGIVEDEQEAQPEVAPEQKAAPKHNLDS